MQIDIMSFVLKITSIFLLLFLVLFPNIFSGQVIGQQSVYALSLPSDGEGVYESCPPSFLVAKCATRLNQIASGGFKIVLNYAMLSDSSTMAQIQQYGNTAAGDGLKVIWALGNWRNFFDGSNLLTTFPAVAQTCGCNSNTGFIQYMISSLKNNPATWGYYVGDETPTSMYSSWITFSNIIHQSDPNHPRLIVFGTSTNNTPIPSANTDISVFANGAEVLGQDYYPIGDDSIGNYTQTAQMAKSVQSLVNNLHKQSAFVLQSESWQDYYPPARCSPYPSCAPYPSSTQMETQLDQTLQNASPRLVLWYSFFDTLQFSNAQTNWNNLVSAANSIYPTSTVTPTPTPTPTLSPTSTQSATPTPTSSITLTQTYTPSPTSISYQTVTPTPLQGQVQILNQNGSVINNATVTFNNGVTQTTTSGIVSIPPNATGIKSLSVDGENIQVNTAISSGNGYQVKVNPQTEQLISVLSFVHINTPIIIVLILTVVLLLAIGLTIILEKSRIKGEDTPYEV